MSEVHKGGRHELSRIYNASETCLFWHLFPTNTQAFKNEDKISGKKLGKDKFSATWGKYFGYPPPQARGHREGCQAKVSQGLSV